MESAQRDIRVRFAYKRLLQVGSAAAALGSIIGLIFTVGGHARGVFGLGSGNGIRLEKVTLQRIPFATYLKTREDVDKLTGLGYGTQELRTKVLAVDFDADFSGWTKGATFPFKLTLETRDASGRTSFLAHDVRETLDASNDHCGCHSFFFVPKHAERFRLTVQVFRPHANRAAAPLQSMQSAWLTASGG